MPMILNVMYCFVVLCFPLPTKFEETYIPYALCLAANHILGNRGHQNGLFVRLSACSFIHLFFLSFVCLFIDSSHFELLHISFETTHCLSLNWNLMVTLIVGLLRPGGHLSINYYNICHLTSMGIPFTKIRQSHDHLPFTMKIPIHGKTVLLLI